MYKLYAGLFFTKKLPVIWIFLKESRGNFNLYYLTWEQKLCKGAELLINHNSTVWTHPTQMVLLHHFQRVWWGQKPYLNYSEYSQKSLICHWKRVFNGVFPNFIKHTYTYIHTCIYGVGGVFIYMDKSCGTNIAGIRHNTRRNIWSKILLKIEVRQNIKTAVLIGFPPGNNNQNIYSFYKQNSPVKKNGSNLNFQQYSYFSRKWLLAGNILSFADSIFCVSNVYSPLNAKCYCGVQTKKQNKASELGEKLKGSILMKKIWVTYNPSFFIFIWTHYCSSKLFTFPREQISNYFTEEHF